MEAFGVILNFSTGVNFLNFVFQEDLAAVLTHVLEPGRVCFPPSAQNV